MTTAMLDRVQLDEITRQARDIHPARTVLTWVAAVLFGLGWLVCKVFVVAWLVCAWMFVATRQGWRAAKVNRGPARPG